MYQYYLIAKHQFAQKGLKMQESDTQKKHIALSTEGDLHDRKEHIERIKKGV